MLHHRYCQRTLQVNAQHIHQMRAFQLGGQQGNMIGMTVIAQHRRHRQAVGNNHQRGFQFKIVAEHHIAFTGFQPFEILDFGHAQHLHLIGVDKIQMADKRQNRLVGFHTDTVIGTGRSGRPGQLQFVLIVLIETAGGNTGHGIILRPEYGGLLPHHRRPSRLHARV